MGIVSPQRVGEPVVNSLVWWLYGHGASFLRHITSPRQYTTSYLMNTNRQENVHEQIPFLYRLWIHQSQDGHRTPCTGGSGIVMPGTIQPDGREVDFSRWKESERMSTAWKFHANSATGWRTQTPLNMHAWKSLVACDVKRAVIASLKNALQPFSMSKSGLVPLSSRMDGCFWIADY